MSGRGRGGRGGRTGTPRAHLERSIRNRALGAPPRCFALQLTFSPPHPLQQDDDEDEEAEASAPEPPAPSREAVQKAQEEQERQLSKKEIKKKELEDLDAVFAELGINVEVRGEPREACFDLLCSGNYHCHVGKCVCHARG